MNDSPSVPLPDLETHLGYWLRLVSNHVSADFGRALQARHVSVAEWVALRHLYDQSGITPGDMAERLSLTRGAVSKVLDKLERKGWIISRIKPQDQRVQTLSLTPEGARLLPRLVEIADSNDRKYFDCLDAQEQEQLAGVLRKLARVHQWKDVPIE